MSHRPALGLLLLRDVTEQIGGVASDERIDFMSTNAEAYRQLESADELKRVREIERHLSGRPRFYIPGVQISEVPLADRLLRIGGQDGIMVARPL